MKNNSGFTALRERVDPRIAGLIGLLVGDSLGCPYEFHAPHQIPPRHKIEMQPADGFLRTRAGVPRSVRGPTMAHKPCGCWQAGLNVAASR